METLQGAVKDHGRCYTSHQWSTFLLRDDYAQLPAELAAPIESWESFRIDDCSHSHYCCRC
jgi:hypothetical protein